MAGVETDVSVLLAKVEHADNPKLTQIAVLAAHFLIFISLSKNKKGSGTAATLVLCIRALRSFSGL